MHRTAVENAEKPEIRAPGGVGSTTATKEADRTVKVGQFLTVFRVLRNTWLTHSIGTLMKGPSVSMAPSYPEIFLAVLRLLRAALRR